LEELFFEQQTKSEASLSKKDEIFSYFVNESNSFCKITNKIANEFGCQTVSLKKKIDGFFTNLAEGGNPRYGRPDWQKESQE
jgi:DNA-directed RNA polymerase delta subunit